MKLFSVSTDGVFTITVGGSSSSQAVRSKAKLSSVNVPSQRMKPGLAICKGTLYLFGGEYENGSKQYTLNDFYSLGKGQITILVIFRNRKSFHTFSFLFGFNFFLNKFPLLFFKIIFYRFAQIG